MLLKAIPLMQAGEMGKLALLLSVLCPGVEQGAATSEAIAPTSAASATLTPPFQSHHLRLVCHEQIIRESNHKLNVHLKG